MVDKKRKLEIEALCYQGADLHSLPGAEAPKTNSLDRYPDLYTRELLKDTGLEVYTIDENYSLSQKSSGGSGEA